MITRQARKWRVTLAALAWLHSHYPISQVTMQLTLTGG